MALVPYTFADQTGVIALSDLDANFANVKAFAETAGNVTGNIQANITAVGSLTSLTVVGNIVAPVFIGDVTGSLTGRVIGSVTGNVAGNVNGNVTGNVAGNVIGNLTGNVSGNVTGNVLGNVTGNVNGNLIGNVTGNVNGNLIGNVSGNVNGNLIGNVSGNVIGDLIGNVTGNVTGNISGNLTVAGGNTQVLFNDSGFANATPGMTFNKNNNNFIVLGNINCANTITGIINSNEVFANGFITGNVLLATSGNIGSPVGVTTLRLGNTNPSTIWIGGNSSNVFIGNVNSNTQIQGNLTTGGNFSATGNIQTNLNGNISGGNLVLTPGTGNAYVHDLSATGSVFVAGVISATGNVRGGNINTSGLLTATGNVTGGNLATAGSISATGNVTGGNIATTGSVSATGNISGGNIIGTIVGTVSTTSVSASGNIQGANLLTGGVVSATGNISGGNLNISGTSTLTGTATAPTAANGTNNTQVATTAFVQNSMLNLLPSGVIVMWSGSIASIPSGWLLCNGTSGTPDLRNRFIVGAGSTYAVNATGGSADAIVVSHTHTASSVVSDPGHNHINGIYDKLLTVSGLGTVTTTNAGTEPDVTQSGTISSSTTGITVTTTVNSSGSSATNANLPPYYALAYIMKA